MSELDEYRRLENKRVTIQRELTSAVRRQVKLAQKIERKKLELGEVNRAIRALDDGRYE